MPLPSPLHTHAGPRLALATVAIAIATAAAGALWLGQPSNPAPAASPDSTHSRRAPAGAKAAAALTAPLGWSLIATADSPVAGYDRPGGAPNRTIPARWHEAPSALPVLEQQPGWLRVQLPTRPNQSTAWVRRADVTVSATPYRIVIHLASRRLELYKSGTRVLSAPAGIGTSDDPTPAGTYFVALVELPPLNESGYGPFVIVTSAHSPTIANWQGSGDALIAIHGPLGQDAQIGTGGAALSHGCVRLHLADLAKLADVPAGTQITITAT